MTSRTRSLGGSEAAAAAGLHPHRTQIELWQELRGDRAPFSGNRFTEWGNILEPSVRLKWAEKNGKTVWVPGASLYRHGWKRASPDGLIAPARDGVGRVLDGMSAEDIDFAVAGLEIKTGSYWTSGRWGESGTDDIPVEYRAQCVWYMHVLKLPVWHVAVLLDTSDYREYVIERDDEVEGLLVAAVTGFWERYVLPGVEPPADGSEAYRKYLGKKWPKISDEILVANDEVDQLVERLRDIGEFQRVATREKELVEQALRQVIGEAAGIKSSHGTVTCRPRKGRKITDWGEVVDDLVACGVSRTLVESLVKKRTTEGEGSRPLLKPREWQKDKDVEQITLYHQRVGQLSSGKDEPS